MEPIIVAVVSALTSIVVALAGAWVARRKGLPAINAEIETRNGELIRLLEGQVSALRSDLTDSTNDFASCKAKLTRALEENDMLTRRVSAAEGDLLSLYRQTGKRPPQRLSTPVPPRRPPDVR